LRACTVDVVEEEGRQRFAVLEQRTGLDTRLAVRVDIRVIDEVAGHQIDRAFDALEFAAHRSGNRAQQGRFAEADAAFEQYVAAREQRDIDQADRVVLPDHRLRGFPLEAKRVTAPILQLLVGTHCLRPRDPRRERAMLADRTATRTAGRIFCASQCGDGEASNDWGKD
jgi:hypothetical protein